MLDLKKAASFYRYVYNHLTKTRKWSHETALNWLASKHWRLVLRLNNLIARKNIIKRHNFREVRPDGRVFVSDTTRCSSLVCAGRM